MVSFPKSMVHSFSLHLPLLMTNIVFFSNGIALMFETSSNAQHKSQTWQLAFENRCNLTKQEVKNFAHIDCIYILIVQSAYSTRLQCIFRPHYFSNMRYFPRAMAIYTLMSRDRFNVFRFFVVEVCVCVCFFVFFLFCPYCASRKTSSRIINQQENRHSNLLVCSL